MLWIKKILEDIPVPLLVERPNITTTVNIYRKFSDNLKKHLLVALFNATPSDVLNKVKHSFNKNLMNNGTRTKN